jgi:HK97 family phage portal protein
MAFFGWTLRRVGTFGESVEEKQAPAAPPDTAAPNVQRRGYEPGIPDGGINEVTQGIGATTQTDRKSLLQELHDVYATCPWVYACVNTIARTITAGGLVMDWDTDTQEGDEEPEKPANVQALEKFLAYCNDTDDIKQVMRNVIVSLLVFGDAYLEVAKVAGVPVAMWNLDTPTLFPIADAHGDVSGYVQVTDFGQRATFTADEVIHISLDSPRPSVFGFSPTNAAMQPIISWLFAASTGKETYRKGDPPTLHVDFPTSTAPAERTRWLGRFMQTILGPLNIGTPVHTVGGATVKELSVNRIANLASWLDGRRDEILATYGVPPAMATVIESGNLGGGTGESQRKMFLTNTCEPIAALVLEKLNYAFTRQGFRISGWHLKFKDVDYRDSKTIEEIRDMRLRNGSWVLDRYRADIGEPPVDGGNQAVLIDRQNLVVWKDIEKLSAAIVAGKGAPAVAAGETPPNGEPVQPGQDTNATQDQAADTAKNSGVDQVQDTPPGQAAKEAAWVHRYRTHLRATLAELEVQEWQKVGV